MNRQALIFSAPFHTYETRQKTQKNIRTSEELLRSEEIKKQTGKLDELVEKSGDILLKIGGVFPFDFFPDEIIIDKEKLSIISRTFFYSSSVRSIMYRNISEVIVDSSILFSTLKVVVRGFLDELINVKYLKKGEAVQARRIIQGLIDASEQNIDVSKLNTREVRRKVERVGRVKEHEE